MSLERKSQTSGFCVRLRAWEQLACCYKQLDFILLEYPFPGKVGYDLGEYPTSIIRLSRRFVWGMHHKSTVLEILSELSEDPT